MNTNYGSKHRDSIEEASKNLPSFNLKKKQTKKIIFQDSSLTSQISLISKNQLQVCLSEWRHLIPEKEMPANMEKQTKQIIIIFWSQFVFLVAN